MSRKGALLAVQGGKFLGELPLLAVEVLSSSTRRIDRLLKLSASEEAGVASYWLGDPDPDAPSLVAMDLAGGRYAEVGRAVGDEQLTVERLFPVTIRPAGLVAGLRS